MPISITLPFPDPQQNLRIGWPRHGAGLAVGGAFDVQGFVSNFGAINTWQAAVGAGTNTMEFRNNILCARFDDIVQRTFTPYALINPLVTNLGAGYRGVEQQRVYRLTVQLSMDGNLGRESGLQFSPASVLTASITGAGQPAFGVVGDGAGGWEYIQSDAGAFPGNITDEVAIGVAVVPDAMDWNTFVFEIINSAPGRTATMSLTVNGALVVSRNWIAPLALPLLTEIANANKFVWAPNCATVGVDLFVGPLTVELGRFTGGGLEILA